MVLDPHHFRPRITFHSNPIPHSALDKLRDAIDSLQTDSVEPSAVGPSTEPTYRQYLVTFFKEVANYDRSVTVRRKGKIELICDFHVDTLRLAPGDCDGDLGGSGSQYDRTSFAIRTREVLGFPLRKSDRAFLGWMGSLLI